MKAENLIDQPAIIIRTYRGSTYLQEVNIENPVTLKRKAITPLYKGDIAWVKVENFKNIEVLDYE